MLGTTRHAGFSLLETIIAITILTISMTAVFTLVSLGVRSVSLSANELTAYFLASEGLEYIRNVRDENALLGAPAFDPLIFGDCIIATGCIVDVRAGGGAGTFGSCPAGVCPRLRFNRDQGIYNHEAWVAGSNEDSIFTRQILMTCKNYNPPNPCPPEEFEVRAIISWRQRAAPFALRSFTINTNLFNK